MPESPRSDARSVIAGRYHLRRPIARGGMAEVWEATDEILGRPVAVKVLLARLAADESFRERFRREAIAAARLAHPNVVAIFDTGVDGGVAYIVMELVDGRTLHDVLATSGPLPPHRAVRIAVQVAAALDYAHQHGIVHRDVKPANILLGDDDRVKVADFGIAKAAVWPGSDGRRFVTSDLTQSGAVVGTAKYVSPEQVNGEDDIDGRADIYSLGVVLYEMLCGRPPFVGDNDVAVALQHVQAAPASPRQVRAGIPRPLEAVVLKALAKSPADRYATAADFQSALLSVDLGADDAVPLVVRDPTPDGVPAPTFRQSERSWLYPAAVILVAAVALGIMGVIFARTDTGQRLLNPRSDEPQGQPVAIAGAQSFDPPPGSRSEHDDELPLLTDGDPATAWTTETYTTSRFGGLKQGVGVVLGLATPGRLDELRVTSASNGWSANVYVADAPKAALQEWGQPVATKTGIDGDVTTFSLDGRQGGAVLLWITDLGPANQVAVGDVRVSGSVPAQG